MTPRCVVITGASSGVGRALALAYAGPGTVLALFARDAARLQEAAIAVSARGSTVQVFAIDTLDAAAMAAALTGFDEKHPMDLLIANAGVSSGTSLEGEPESATDADRVMRTNILGTLNSIHPAIALMRTRGRGQIAIMGSLAAQMPLPFAPAYSASKAAIEKYALALRGALQPDGIGVCVISPGYVESPMSAQLSGPKPFLLSAERAADLIRVRLQRNPARIAFPWPLAIAAGLAGRLPFGLQRVMLAFFAFRVRQR